MPSGPKKRRAAKKKNDVGSSFPTPKGEEEKLKNVSITNASDQNAESENVERSDDVPVLESDVTKEKESEFLENKGKESENESLCGEFSMHVPVLESMITEKKLSESGDPGSEDTKVNESHGPLPMVNEFLADLKNSEKVNLEGFIEDPFKEAHILLLKCLHAMTIAIDKSVMKLPSKEAEDSPLATDPASELNVDASLKDAEDSRKETIGSSIVDDASPKGGDQRDGLLKGLARELTALVEEETRLKASYDDWHKRFNKFGFGLTLYLSFRDCQEE